MTFFLAALDHARRQLCRAGGVWVDALLTTRSPLTYEKSDYFEDADAFADKEAEEEVAEGTDLKLGLEQFARGEGVSSDWLFEEYDDGVERWYHGLSDDERRAQLQDAIKGLYSGMPPGMFNGPIPDFGDPDALADRQPFSCISCRSSFTSPSDLNSHSFQNHLQFDKVSDDPAVKYERYPGVTDSGDFIWKRVKVTQGSGVAAAPQSAASATPAGVCAPSEAPPAGPQLPMFKASDLIDLAEQYIDDICRYPVATDGKWSRYVAEVVVSAITAELTGLAYDQSPGVVVPSTVTRVVLVHDFYPNRTVTAKWAESWDVRVQDDGRTLKLFSKKPTGPRYEYTPGFFDLPEK